MSIHLEPHVAHVAPASLQSILTARGKSLVTPEEAKALSNLQRQCETLQGQLNWLSDDSLKDREKQLIAKIVEDPLGFCDPKALKAGLHSEQILVLRKGLKAGFKKFSKDQVVPAAVKILERAIPIVKELRQEFAEQEQANARTAAVTFNPSPTLQAVTELLSAIPKRIAEIKAGVNAVTPRSVLRGLVEI